MGSRLATRRSFLSGGLASVALAALSACGAGRDDALGSGDVTVRPLTVGIAPPQSLDPYNACDQGSLTVAWQLFDALTSYDFATGELTCLAAERYEMSDDAASFTFYLREATFHSGEPVTAADFKRAWERIVNPQSAAAGAGGQSGLSHLLSLIEGYDELANGEVGELAGVTCPDDRTLVVSLRTPYADFPYVLAHPALGPVPAEAERDAQGFAQQPIGNGSFMLARAWADSVEAIELARYAGYYGAAPAIESAVLQPYRAIDDAFQSFQTGDADISRCPVDEARTVSSNLGRAEDGRTLTHEDRFVCAPDLSTSMLACNCSIVPLNNAYVRRALSLAIDRDYLCDTLYRGTRIAADGIVPPGVAGYRDAAWPYALYDRAQAAELLDGAYPLDDDDARSLSLHLLYHADGGHGEIIDAIVGNFEDVGVDCIAEGVGLETFYDRLRRGDFELARVDWAADAPIMDNVLFPLFFSGNIGSSNYARYRSEQVDRALAQARAEGSEDARAALYQDADDTVALDCPVIPLLYHAQSYVASERIEELAVDPQGRIDLAGAVLCEE